MNSLFKSLSCIALVSVLLGASGCATVVKGTDESVTVMTEPQGAICSLDRDGETIAVVNPTPGTVEVDRDADDIVVTCDLEDHETTVGHISSEFSGATLGNILLGGLLGVAVDAASGANNEYPDSITLIMLPEEFESEAQRDEIYEKLKQQVRDRAERMKADKKNQCVDEEICNKRIAQIDQARDDEIAELENKRLNADIGKPKAEVLDAPPSEQLEQEAGSSE